MAIITTHDVTNQQKDLSDVLSTLITLKPSFITRFASVPVATSTKHEWLNDVLKPLEVAYTGYTQATGVFAVASSVGWSAGDLVRVKGDSAIFRITATAATSITVEFVASNGSATDAIGDIGTGAGTLIFDSHPIVEGSTAGPEVYSQSGTDHNFTQIFRSEVNISNTALAIRQYGNENSVSVQMERALLQLKNNINRAALFGTRLVSTASVPGQAGGLYYYGTLTGANEVNATVSQTAGALTLKLINDAAETILAGGGEPNLILCGSGQARVLSQVMKSQISIQMRDASRGVYANTAILESNGSTLEVFVDPALDALNTDVWVLDSRGLGLSYLNGRTLKSVPITTPGTDGTREMIIGELTFEFKNYAQRLCRIKGLMAPASALS